MTARTPLLAHPSLAFALAVGHLAGAAVALATLPAPAALVICIGLGTGLASHWLRLARQRNEVAIVSPSGDTALWSQEQVIPLDGQVLCSQMLVLIPLEGTSSGHARPVLASPARLRRLRVALRWGGSRQDPGN